MKLVWVVIPLILIGIVGVPESFPTVPSSPFSANITISHPPNLNENADVTLTFVNVHGFNQDTIEQFPVIIRLPDGLELVSGELEIIHFWQQGDTLEVTVEIKAIQNGNWTIQGVGYGGAVDYLHLVIDEDLSYIHEGNFPSKLPPDYPKKKDYENILKEFFAEEFSKEFYISNGFDFINYSDQFGTYSIPYKITSGEIIEFIPNIWDTYNRHEEIQFKIKSITDGNFTILTPYSHILGWDKIFHHSATLNDSPIEYIKNEYDNTLVVQFSNSSTISFHPFCYNDIGGECADMRYHEPYFTFFKLKEQVKNGVDPSDIICPDGLSNLRTDDRLRCVTSETYGKLIMRNHHFSRF